MFIEDVSGGKPRHPRWKQANSQPRGSTKGEKGQTDKQTNTDNPYKKNRQSSSWPGFRDGRAQAG